MKTLEDKIFFISKYIKNIKLQKKITDHKTLIFDFYNVYCSFVKFNKYQTFSEITVKKCLDIIAKKFIEHEIILVSKDIFEYNEKSILDITSQYKNITYITVHDKYLEKSVNRERDDYICILLQQKILFPEIKNPITVTNDKFRNFNLILSNIKSISINIYKEGKEPQTISISSFSLRKMNEILKRKNTIETTAFSFI